jgi:hypothetical protein
MACHECGLKALPNIRYCIGFGHEMTTRTKQQCVTVLFRGTAVARRRQRRFVVCKFITLIIHRRLQQTDGRCLQEALESTIWRESLL